MASHSSGCSFLYPDQNQSNSDIVLRQQDGQYEVFYHLETTIKEKCCKEKVTCKSLWKEKQKCKDGEDYDEDDYFDKDSDDFYDAEDC